MSKINALHVQDMRKRTAQKIIKSSLKCWTLRLASGIARAPILKINYLETYEFLFQCPKYRWCCKIDIEFIKGNFFKIM